MELTIHVGHSIGRKNGTHYAARAYCVGPLGPHSFKISIDDTAAEAEENAIQYVKQSYLSDGMAPPETIARHGRLPRAILDNLQFHKHA